MCGRPWARVAARRERARRLRAEYATPRNLSSVEVDVVVPQEQQSTERPAASRKATVVVREGDSLDATVRAFMAGAGHCTGYMRATSFNTRVNPRC